MWIGNIRLPDFFQSFSPKIDNLQATNLNTKDFPKNRKDKNNQVISFEKGDWYLDFIHQLLGRHYGYSDELIDTHDDMFWYAE